MKARPLLYSLLLLLALAAVSVPVLLGGFGETGSVRLVPSSDKALRAIQGITEQIPVYVNGQGVLVEAGVAAATPGTSDLRLALFPDKAQAASECSRAFILPSNLSTLWQLQKETEKEEIKAEMRTMLADLGQGLRDLRASPDFSARYASRLRGAAMDSASEAFSDPEVRRNAERALWHTTRSLSVKLVPVVTAVTADVSLHRTVGFVKDLALAVVPDGLKESAPEENGETTVKQEEVRTFHDEIMADPRTTDAISKTVESIGDSQDVNRLLGAFSSGFVTGFLSDERTEALLEELIADPELLPHLESTGRLMLDSLQRIGYLLATLPHDEDTDPFVPVVLNALLYGKGSAFVLLQAPGDDVLGLERAFPELDIVREEGST